MDFDFKGLKDLYESLTKNKIMRGIVLFACAVFVLFQVTALVKGWMGEPVSFFGTEFNQPEPTPTSKTNKGYIINDGSDNTDMQDIRLYEAEYVSNCQIADSKLLEIASVFQGTDSVVYIFSRNVIPETRLSRELDSRLRGLGFVNVHQYDVSATKSFQTKPPYVLIKNENITVIK